MKKLMHVSLVVIAILLLAACGNSPEDKLVGKEFYVEYKDDADSDPKIENTIIFDKDGIVTATSTEVTTVQSVGKYELGDELINDKYYLLNADVEGLNCSDKFLFDPENMTLHVFDVEDGDYQLWDSCEHQLVEK